MKRADIIAGILGILLSTYVFIETGKFPEDRILLMGPSFFPRLLAFGLLILSISLLVRALMGKAMEQKENFDLRDPGIQRAGISVLATVIYCLVLPKTGFILTSIIYLFFLMYLLKQRSYLKMVGISATVTLAVFTVFRVLLNITLPLGIFG